MDYGSLGIIYYSFSEYLTNVISYKLQLYFVLGLRRTSYGLTNK